MGWVSGITVSCGVGRRCGSDPVLLWHRPVAATQIWPLAWELPHAIKKKKKIYIYIHIHIYPVVVSIFTSFVLKDDLHWILKSMFTTIASSTRENPYTSQRRPFGSVLYVPVWGTEMVLMFLELNEIKFHTWMCIYRKHWMMKQTYFISGLQLWLKCLSDVCNMVL